MLVRDVRHSAESLPDGTYVTTLHIQHLPNSLSLLLCYTDSILYGCEQNWRNTHSVGVKYIG
jgi:hypothetical protein